MENEENYKTPYDIKMKIITSTRREKEVRIPQYKTSDDYIRMMKILFSLIYIFSTASIPKRFKQFLKTVLVA